MCGIVGMMNINGNLVDEVSHVKRMMDVQSHRGPDDEGMRGFCYDGFSEEIVPSAYRKRHRYDGILGFNRLSILDLSARGHQPMTDMDGQVIITFNGEIYNAFDYKRELIKEGVRFKSDTDTEVILKLYIKYGFDKMIKMLNGMFALVIVDLKCRQIWMARDRFGIKPFYYTLLNGRMIYASEIKSIIQIPEFKRQICEEGLKEFFTFRATAGASLLKNINQIQPGTYITINNGRISKDAFFDINDFVRPINKRLSFYDEKEKIEEKLEQAVKRQMVSDVKVGCQLSGGIDSSLVTYYAANRQDSQLKDAISIIFSNPNYSEEEYMDKVAEKVDLNVHKYILDDEFLLDNMYDVIWHLDTIAIHPNAFGIYKIAQNAKKHVTVLLSGEGADELMGGYSQFPGGYFVNAYFRVRSLLKMRGIDKIEKKIFRGEDNCSTFDEFAVLYTASTSNKLCKQLIPNYDRRSLINKRLNVIRNFSGSDFDRQIKYEMSIYLPELLLRQDKMSMASSIENRVPLLDNELVDAAFQIPEKMLCHWKLPIGQGGDIIRNSVSGKYILKKICADKYGYDFAFRKKSGFPIPLKDYMKAEKFRDQYYEVILKSMKEREILRAECVQKMYENIDLLRENEIDVLWRSINFEIWCELFVDDNNKR